MVIELLYFPISLRLRIVVRHLGPTWVVDTDANVSRRRPATYPDTLAINNVNQTIKPILYTRYFPRYA